MLASSFFDPNANGWDITDLASILGLVLGICAVVASIWKLFQLAAEKFAREVREIVKDEIATATLPIQPGYRNGGESLADLAHAVKAIAAKQGVSLD